MILFADTNWLVAVYFIKRDEERTAVAERFARRQGACFVVSQLVLLEARNVFGRISGEANPVEWQRLLSDFGRRIHPDLMNWDLQRQRTNELFERYSHKAEIGTFDTALVASALLAGATHFLSWDQTVKAVAVAERLRVFPELNSKGRAVLAKLR